MVRLSLTPATQFATAYDAEGNPVATVARRRVSQRSGPVWRAFDLNGTMIAEGDHGQDIRRAIRLHLTLATASNVAELESFRHGR